MKKLEDLPLEEREEIADDLGLVATPFSIERSEDNGKTWRPSVPCKDQAEGEEFFEAMLEDSEGELSLRLVNEADHSLVRAFISLA